MDKCEITDITVDADVVGHILEIDGKYIAGDFTHHPVVVGLSCANCGEEFGYEDGDIHQAVTEHLAKVLA